MVLTMILRYVCDDAPDLCSPDEHAPDLCSPDEHAPFGMPGMRILGSIATITVPAHGYISGLRGAVAAAPGFASQIWDFFKQIIRGCAWAAAIAAGMLVYTTFTAKWKDKGYPIIPIAALMAADQSMPGIGRSIPLASVTQTSTTSTQTQSRQTSLLDLEDYNG